MGVDFNATYDMT